MKLTECPMNRSRRDFLKLAGLGAAALACPGLIRPAAAAEAHRPNIIFIIADDLGHTDLGCYGATNIKTPNLDRMAAEGLRLTDFHTPTGVCTPTRAALMTGCYPKRVDLHVAVLSPNDARGLNPGEITIAELLREQGYATAMIGKWHLGVQPEFLPTRQGFDSYYGMPGPNHGASDLFRDEQRIATNAEVNLDDWTADCTREALGIIRKAKKDRPFFLYLAHGAPHNPLRVSQRFADKSERGLYGEVIEEVDWSIGEILKTLREEGLDGNTLVVFTSDNGPSGQAAPPLHGGKGSTWEGGHRVPCILRWPGRIEAGTTYDGLAAMMDFYPTLAHLGGAKTPADRTIDGLNFGPALLDGAKPESPRTTLFYGARDGQTAAVREGKWKLHVVAPVERWAGKLPEKEALLDKKPATAPPWLYDLEADIGETRDVSAEHPEIVQRLQKLIEEFDARMEKERRPAGVSASAAANAEIAPKKGKKKKKNAP